MTDVWKAKIAEADSQLSLLSSLVHANPSLEKLITAFDQAGLTTGTAICTCCKRHSQPGISLPEPPEWLNSLYATLYQIATAPESRAASRMALDQLLAAKKDS